MRKMNSVVTKSSKENLLNEIYGSDVKYHEKRFSRLTDKFKSIYNTLPTHLFSTPGRVELSGNHTDHNHGKVIAASIDLDSIAAASISNNEIISISSEGYRDNLEISINDLEPVTEEQGSTTALIRGVSNGFKSKGYQIGGFNAVISSEVLVGSGLSSSASFEILIATIINTLFNESRIPIEELALIGQQAENNYFGKPCGLMDQVACAAGNIVSIDFLDPVNPLIEKLEVDFDSTGYKLVIVDTGSNHADLTDDYASIPQEMQMVASLLGKKYLRECSEDEFYNDIIKIRKKLGDRSVLRTIHFFEENRRVEKQVAALKKNNFNTFLSYVNQSGNSSFKYLQNIYTPQNVNKQGISLALALTEKFIKETGVGACRINGGGFAGTIEAFIPVNKVNEYSEVISKVFGEMSVKVLSIRKQGTICINS